MDQSRYGIILTGSCLVARQSHNTAPIQKKVYQITNETAKTSPYYNRSYSSGEEIQLKYDT